MEKESLKKCCAAFVVAYTGIIAFTCVLGVVFAAYDLFIGGYKNVYEGDWLLVEIPYIFIWGYWYTHLIRKPYKDPIYTTLNDIKGADFDIDK